MEGMAIDYDDLRKVDPKSIRDSKRLKFSALELKHIVISILVLSIAFAMVMLHGFKVTFDDIEFVLRIVGISLILVVFSFFIHELGHKFVAQHYGAWSEFRMFPSGLAIALVSGFLGFLFAAPGAVYIQGNIDKKQNGIISLAGPGVNFAMAAIALIIAAATSSSYEWLIVQLAYLNAFLGLFNLIPIPPFDGSKIITWNLPAYLMLAAIGIIELVIIF